MIKHKGEVSQAVIVIGILALVFITVSTAYLSLNKVELPQDQNQVIQGNHLRVSGKLAALADSCWRKAGKGTRSKVMDCFKVKVYSNATVTESNISRDLEVLSRNKLGLTGGPIPDREVRLEVTYLPVEKRVNISVISVCRPSSGDTCFSTACSCKTACAPGFDPDGDGSPETNAKGCLKSYSFTPSYNPCSSSSSLTCSDPSIYRSGTKSGNYFTFDIGSHVGLLNVTLVSRSSNSFYGFRMAEAENRISPRKVVGYGSVDRKLFTGKGNLSISGLPNGQYAAFVWGCDKGSIPSNCRWLRPFEFEKN
ncbi:MAG: hypothetical protein ABEJ87_01565 [Candidatus Nanohalobium sp.]